MFKYMIPWKHFYKKKSKIIIIIIIIRLFFAEICVVRWCIRKPYLIQTLFYKKTRISLNDYHIWKWDFMQNIQDCSRPTNGIDHLEKQLNQHSGHQSSRKSFSCYNKKVIPVKHHFDVTYMTNGKLLQYVIIKTSFGTNC